METYGEWKGHTYRSHPEQRIRAVNFRSTVSQKEYCVSWP